MFCVIVKLNGYAGDNVTVMGPYENKIQARKAQRDAKKRLIEMGAKVENISTEVKEMVFEF